MLGKHDPFCDFFPKDVCFRVTLSALLCCKAYSFFLFQKLLLSSSVSVHLLLFYVFCRNCIPVKTCPFPLNTLLSLSLSISTLFCRTFLWLFISPLFLSQSFCLGDWGWLCGAEQFWPSRCLWPRSIMAFPFRAGSYWCGVPGREIE